MKKHTLKNIFILFTLLFSIQHLCYSQKQGQGKIDSLLSELPKAKEDTNKVNLLNDLSTTYTQINPNEGIKFGLQALTLAEKLIWKKGKANANMAIGINSFGESINTGLPTIGWSEHILWGKSKYAKALEYYLKALIINEELRDTTGIKIALQNISLAYLMQLDYPKTLEFDFKILKLNESIEDKKEIAESLKQIGFVYLSQNDFNNAFVFYLKALNLYEDLADTSGKAVILHSILEIGEEKEYQDNVKDDLYFISIIILLLILSIVLFKRFRLKKRSNILLAKEKKRSDDLLLNILPSEIAEELKAKGESEAKQFDNVTVLLADFVNFTNASEKLSPKELVSEINHCFTAFDEIIGRNGLEKIKTIGDAYLAVCGLPLADDKHGKKTVTAAQEISQFMNERKKTLRMKDGLGEIRIGINSGSVVAGIVGVKKFAYDIWGDTVNLAARMEQNCEAGKINISGATYALVKNDFNCIHRGKIEAKNKGIIDMYFVEIIA